MNDRGRLALLPGLRRLWRDGHSLQLGTDPQRAMVLEFADPRLARALDLLDGTRTHRMILRDAAGLGISEPAARSLLEAVCTAGLAVAADTLLPAGVPEPARHRLATEGAALALRGHPPPAERLRRRAAARVLISGYARLAVPIAAALAEAGVGHVDPALSGRVQPADTGLGGLLPADRTRPRATAAADAVRRVAATATVRQLRDGTATFVVEVGTVRPPALAALALGRRGVPHLAVEIRDGVPVIGPLVPPAGSPCLNCLDLHRTDHDPAWPALVAQLATGGDTAPPCAVGIALMATGYAVEEVLSYLDGDDPQTVGTTIEIMGPGRERRRRWTPHPRCDCGRRRSGGRSSGQ